jgi:hypothetical protein
MFYIHSQNTTELMPCHRYQTAFKAIMICYALVILISLTLRLYLTWMNKSRDRKEGVVQNTEEEIMARMDKNLTAEDYEDVTDLKTLGFRYRM